MQYIKSVTWNQLKQPKLMIPTTNIVWSALDSPYFENMFIKSLSLWIYYAWTYKDLPAFGLPVCILWQNSKELGFSLYIIHELLEPLKESRPG